VHLADVLAKKCKREGNKFEVVVDGLRRLWVDMSIPLGIEAGHKNYALEAMAKVQGLYEDVIVNNPLLPSELTKDVSLLREGLVGVGGALDKINEVQGKLSVNIEGHLKLVGAIIRASEGLERRKHGLELRERIVGMREKGQKPLNRWA